MPGYLTQPTVAKEWLLASQMLGHVSDLDILHQSVADTVMALSGKVWPADLAYYLSALEASRRIRGGAEAM